MQKWMITGMIEIFAIFRILCHSRCMFCGVENCQWYNGKKDNISGYNRSRVQYKQSKICNSQFEQNASSNVYAFRTSSTSKKPQLKSHNNSLMTRKVAKSKNQKKRKLMIKLKLLNIKANKTYRLLLKGSIWQEVKASFRLDWCSKKSDLARGQLKNMNEIFKYNQH